MGFWPHMRMWDSSMSAKEASYLLLGSAALCFRSCTDSGKACCERGSEIEPVIVVESLASTAFGVCLW
jgi:hypothetical protein